MTTDPNNLEPTRQEAAAERKARRQALARQVLALRRQGASFDDIAAALHISRSNARRLYLKEGRRLDRERKATAEVALTLELDKLDALTQRAFAVLNDRYSTPENQLRAIDRLLKVIDRRVRLLGLEVPQKIAFTDPSGEVPCLALTDELRARKIAELLSRVKAND